MKNVSISYIDLVITKYIEKVQRTQKREVR